MDIISSAAYKKIKEQKDITVDALEENHSRSSATTVASETSLTKTYDEISVWSKTTVLKYGSRSEISEAEAQIAKFESILASSKSEDESSIEMVKTIQQKKTEIEIVREANKKILGLHGDLLAQIETADQQRNKIKHEEKTLSENLNIDEEYEVSYKI